MKAFCVRRVHKMKKRQDCYVFYVLSVLLALGASVMGDAFSCDRGAIKVDPEHPAWLLYGDNAPFYMCGPGDPEGFLYRGLRKADGTREGDQQALIRKMAGTGANCIYMIMVRSHGGDGAADENPFVNGDPWQGLNTAILDQWDQWFSEMNRQGIVIFLFFYDDSAAPFHRDLTDGALDPREEQFIDTVVARFHHHPYLIWCVAEEYIEAVSPARAAKIAERIKAQDPLRHPVAVHQNHGTVFDFTDNIHVDQFAMQFNTASSDSLHEAAVSAWQNTGGRKNINLSEFQPRPTGLALQKTIWSIAFGGAYSMILQMDIDKTKEEDLKICGGLVRFMESVRFNETAPSDALARGDSRYVLARPGQLYLIYSETGRYPGVDLQAGCYTLQWFDISSGRWFHGGRKTLSGGEQYFKKPASVGAAAVLYLVSCL